MREPYTRPALPRTSSATSGFFFWGMMDEPVEYASSNSANLNSHEHHRIISSAKRERWVIKIDRSDNNSKAKSRSDTASIELSMGLEKPRSLAVSNRSTGYAEVASAPAPRGHSSRRARQSSNRVTSRRNMLA